MNPGNGIGFGCEQSKGMRTEQQDSFCYSEVSLNALCSDCGVMAAVADGMGGQTQGARASQLAVSTFYEEYSRKRPGEPVSTALDRALREANAAVHDANRRDECGDMGTTLTACVMQDDSLYWISAGDSRLYLCRGGSIDKLNLEHSFGEELNAGLRAGTITEHEARAKAKKRHVLTSYLGLRQIPKINLSAQPVRLKPGDRVLLCSDGLYNALSPREIHALVQGNERTPAKCHGLVQAALRKMRPNQDNITVLMLEYGSAGQAGWMGPRLSLASKLGIAAAILALVVSISFAIAHFAPRQEIKPTQSPVNSTATNPEAQPFEPDRATPGSTPAKQESVKHPAAGGGTNNRGAVNPNRGNVTTHNTDQSNAVLAQPSIADMSHNATQAEAPTAAQ